MAVPPFLLEQVLRLPEDKNVRNSPIVTAIILRDPANAADLVPYLDHADEVVSANARRILCLFAADAVPHLVAALANRSAAARTDGLDVLWTLLISEPAPVIRDTLEQIASDLEPLFADKRPLAVELPAHIERDFLGRICDHAYLVIAEILDPDFDQSRFRALAEDGRNEEIKRLKARGIGLNIV